MTTKDTGTGKGSPSFNGYDTKKGGTPRKRPPDAELEDIANRVGGVNVGAAEIIGCSEGLVRKWRLKFPKVESMFLRAEERATGLITLRVLNAALKGEAWACCFWLKCRAGWQERPSREVESADARERREEQKSLVERAMADPESRKAASAFIASLYKSPVRVPADEKPN